MTTTTAEHLPADPRGSLRERKYARTKLALMHAAVDRLNKKPFADITVRELCEAVELSEATFFNYFPRKSDLLLYFVQIWTIQVALHAADAVGPGKGIPMIEKVFELTADQITERPRVMKEIIAHMALAEDADICPGQLPKLTLEERLQAFPEHPQAVGISGSAGLDGVFVPPLRRAMAVGELPPSTDLSLAVGTLVSIFFGVPLGLRVCAVEEGHRYESHAEAYRAQLALLWVGLRG